MNEQAMRKELVSMLAKLALLNPDAYQIAYELEFDAYNECYEEQL